MSAKEYLLCATGSASAFYGDVFTSMHWRSQWHPRISSLWMAAGDVGGSRGELAPWGFRLLGLHLKFVFAVVCHPFWAFSRAPGVDAPGYDVSPLSGLTNRQTRQINLKITAVEAAQTKAQGRSTRRRLNRQEYEYTLRDLLDALRPARPNCRVASGLNAESHSPPHFLPRVHAFFAKTLKDKDGLTLREAFAHGFQHIFSGSNWL